MVDEINTASVLIGLSQTTVETIIKENSSVSLSSTQRQSTQNVFCESAIVVYSNEQEEQQPNKRVRRQGRYSPQEREIIR